MIALKSRLPQWNFWLKTRCEGLRGSLRFEQLIGCLRQKLLVRSQVEVELQEHKQAKASEDG